MTLISLFSEIDGGTDGAVRLKIIRPVYEIIQVIEPAAQYFTKRLSSSTDVADAFSFLRQESKEHFLALHLDSKNKLICIDHVSSGSLSACVVHPREVFKSALLSSAAALILIHNHPSGDSTPSREDHEITKRLKDASELLGIRLLDHVVIGERVYSFADHGTL